MLSAKRFLKTFAYQQGGGQEELLQLSLLSLNNFCTLLRQISVRKIKFLDQVIILPQLLCTLR